jgi:hypothetical protein
MLGLGITYSGDYLQATRLLLSYLQEYGDYPHGEYLHQTCSGALGMEPLWPGRT